MIRERTLRKHKKLVETLPITGELLRGTLLQRVVHHKSGCPNDWPISGTARGYYGLPLPTELGGQGADMVTAAFSLVEISKTSAAVGFTLDAHWLSAETILHFGTDKQKE